MNCFCRTCGHITPRIPLEKKHETFVAAIIWQWSMLDFGDKSKIQICNSCLKLLKKHHKKDYSRRNDGRQARCRISIAMWDSAKDCPIYNQNGLPMFYKVLPKRRLNRQLRNINEQQANAEAMIPPVNPIHLVDISDHSLQPTGDTNVSNRQRKSDRSRNKNKENINILHSKITENIEEGLVIINCGTIIGRGIETSKPFRASEYVATYKGSLLNKVDAELIEIEYANNGEDMCYTHYFRWNEKVYCYDGTNDDGSFGRLINHSRLNPNIQPKVEIIRDKPYIYFKAINNIPAGTELRYDYGDRKTDLSWLKY